MDVLPNPLVGVNNAREEARLDLLAHIHELVERFCPRCGKQLYLKGHQWECSYCPYRE